MPFSEALPSRLFWPQAEKHTKSGVQNHQTDVLHSNIAPPCLHRIALVDFDLDSPSQNPRFVQGQIFGCWAWFFQVTFLGVLPDLYLGDQKLTWKKPKGVEMCGPAERPHNRKRETMRNCNTSAQQDIAIWNYLMIKWCNLNMFAWQEYLAISLHGIRICFPNFL